MAEIEIRALRKAFDSAEVLKGVDLTIEDGEFISLVGPSGCGKSTLLRIIAGLEPQSSGEILIDRASVDGVRPSARNLAMVFQSYALYPHLSVFDNIAVPLRMKRLSTLERAPLVGKLLPGRRRVERTIRADVERVAEQLEISSLLKRKPGQLSGGQRQRVAVGRAIVRQPRAFLFDEPLSNLDAKLRVHMRAEIAQLHRKLKTTFIYVTHDQAEAMTMSGRIAVMIGGELIQVGTPAAIYEDPHDIRVAEFVGTPKINSFPGTVRGDGRLEVLGHTIPAATPSAAGECRVCVRPERIGLGEAGTLSGTVVHLENLGSEAFVHIGSAGMDAPVVARVNDPRQLPAIGTAISYGFAPDAVRAFDAGGNSTSGTSAMMTLYKEGLLDKDYASVKVLGLYVLPPYPIFTTGKKIQSVKDFRGLRMRAPSTTVGVALAKLGAVPLGIPLNMIGDTIASGYVDAIAYGWDSTTTTKGAGGKYLADQLSVVIDARLAAPALMIVMNRAAWDSMPVDLRKIVEKHASDLAMGSARIREAQEAITKKKLQTDPRITVLNFNDEQRAELQRVTAPAVAEWKANMAKLGIDGERLYARARELIQQYKVATK